MPDRRPEFVTDEMIKPVNNLTIDHIYKYCEYMMASYGDRHGLMQTEIDAHKGRVMRLHEDWKKAEKTRLEIVISKRQHEIDELKAALNGYL